MYKKYEKYLNRDLTLEITMVFPLQEKFRHKPHINFTYLLNQLRLNCPEHKSAAVLKMTLHYELLLILVQESRIFLFKLPFSP